MPHRLVSLLAVLTLAAASSGAASAQVLDLYTETTSDLDAATLIPLLEERYGPVTRDRPGSRSVMEPGDPDSPLRAVQIDQPVGFPAFFFFCDGTLMAFDAPANVAEVTEMAQSAAQSPVVQTVEAMLYGSHIQMQTDDPQLVITVTDADAAAGAGMRATYPYEAFLLLDFYDRCRPDG